MFFIYLITILCSKNNYLKEKELFEENDITQACTSQNNGFLMNILTNSDSQKLGNNNKRPRKNKEKVDTNIIKEGLHKKQRPNFKYPFGISNSKTYTMEDESTREGSHETKSGESRKVTNFLPFFTKDQKVNKPLDFNESVLSDPINIYENSEKVLVDYNTSQYTEKYGIQFKSEIVNGKVLINVTGYFFEMEDFLRFNEFYAMIFQENIEISSIFSRIQDIQTDINTQSRSFVDISFISISEYYLNISTLIDKKAEFYQLSIMLIRLVIEKTFKIQPKCLSDMVEDLLKILNINGKDKPMNFIRYFSDLAYCTAMVQYLQSIRSLLEIEKQNLYKNERKNIKKEIEIVRKIKRECFEIMYKIYEGFKPCSLLYETTKDYRNMILKAIRN